MRRSPGPIPAEVAMPHLRATIARAALLPILLGAALPAPSAVAQEPKVRLPTQPLPEYNGLGSPLYNHIDWWAFHDAGWRAMEKGWYDTAEREFLSALRIAKRPAMNDPRLLARTYSSLAWALQQQSKVAQAEPLARWALQVREQQFGPDAEPVARSLNQVATIQLALGRFAAAEPLLRRVAAMRSTRSVEMRREQAQSRSLLGLGLAADRLYARAEVEFARAVELRQAAQGSKHPEVGDELNNLGWVRLEQGKLAEARRDFEKALDILEQRRGVDDPSVARVLDGLARLDAEQKNYPEAESKYRRLIGIDEVLGDKSRLADALKRYADVLDRMNRPADAARARARLAPTTAGKPLDDNVNLVAPKGPASSPNGPASPAPRGRT